MRSLSKLCKVLKASFRKHLETNTPPQVNLKKIITTVLTLQEMFKGHLEVKDDKQHPGSTGKNTIHCEADKPEKNKRINSSNHSEINK